MTVEAGQSHLTNAKIDLEKAQRIWKEKSEPTVEFNALLQAALVESQRAQTELRLVVAEFCNHHRLSI